MRGIFISYRRDDTAGYAGRLAEELGGRFGRTKVFLDIHDIPAGADFEEHVHETLNRSSVTLVLIGEQWLTVKRPDGTRRIDQEGDYVRMEVAAALGHTDGVVIPVLVEGAAMPSSDQLPADIEALARRNAVELSNKRWRYDVRQLRNSILKVTANGFLPRLVYRVRGSRRAAVGLAVVTAAAAVLGLTLPGTSSGGLKVDDIPVSNALHQYRNLANGRSALVERTKPTLEIKVHNLTKRTVDVTSARFTVTDVVHLPPCVSAANIPLTGIYDTVLPLTRGGVVTKQVNQQVPADGIDRFQVRFDLPVSAYGKTGEDMWVLRLHVELLHDGASRPVDGGYATLSFAGVPNPANFALIWSKASAAQRSTLERQWGAGTVRCSMRQTVGLKRLLSRPAHRSAELGRLARQLVAPG